jgi:hypothetical protein
VLLRVIVFSGGGPADGAYDSVLCLFKAGDDEGGVGTDVGGTGGEE